MPVKAFIGLLVGVAFVWLAMQALGQRPDDVKAIVAGIDLVSKVVGFVGVAAGFGKLLGTAGTSNGLTNINANELAGWSAITVAGAILLVA